MDVPDIVLVRDGPIPAVALRELVSRFFEEMVKFVVDVERGWLRWGATCTRTPKRPCWTTGADGKTCGCELLPRDGR